MTDRDRLVEDLHHEGIGCRRLPDDTNVDEMGVANHVRDADRLIALGWTRLDEERLARALTEVQGGRYESWLGRVPLIAKAYREDTDDRP